MREFTGGLDVAELDGRDREPWMRLRMSVDDRIPEKDTKRCKGIFERALSELKEVVGPMN